MKIEKMVLLVGVLSGGIVASQAQNAVPTSSATAIGMDDARIVLLGQIDTGNPKSPRLGYPGTRIVVRFKGSSLALFLSCDSEKSALTVVVDHGAPTLQLLQKGEQKIVLASTLNAGRHTVEVYKRTETWQGIVTLRSVELPVDGALLPAAVLPARKLMFIGDSVTCGAGVDNNPTCTESLTHPITDAYHSYGMELGRRLDAQTHLVCYGGRGLDRDYRGLSIVDNVLNAPQFLDLSIASDEVGIRSSWDFRRWTPDGIVISLGTNDFNLQETKPLNEGIWVGDFARFLQTVRSEYPQAAIQVTEGAIVTDPLLRRYIQEAVAYVHDPRIQWVQAEHYPGNGCNPHPDALQHLRMADDLEPMLRRALGW